MFLPIRNTIQVAGVSRSTVYYWMERAWIHWRELPSGRRVICQESLSHQARQLDANLHVHK
jgi:predicted site-specific integrase-resolvase